MLSVLIWSATERRLQTQTPADTVLTHFRIVRYVLLIPMSQAIDVNACCLWLQFKLVMFCLRQQDQALQSQRHTALLRLNHLKCTAATRQQIVSGRADAHLPVLVRRCVYSSDATPCHTVIGVEKNN